MGKRPDGTLEQEIMSILWSTAAPLQPAEIRDRLAEPLAYTSVATVLGRLQAKGLVTRTPAGRGFAYAAAVAESELAARRLHDVLAAAADRDAALLSFVGGLSRRDLRALKAMLDGEDP